MHADFNLLTSRQKKVYSVIESYIKYNGIPPTVREIGELIGEKTPGAVQGILNRMEQKGVITRQQGLARSIRLAADKSIYETPVYIPELKKIDKRNIDNLFSIYNISKFTPVSPEITGRSEGLFIINCPDDSLSGLGITINDKLVIDTKTICETDDTVIVFYNEQVMLRIFLSENDNGMISLATGYEMGMEKHFSKNDLVVIGKVVCKFTQY